MIKNLSDDFLKNKKIAIGVTGSIAAYKSAELVRLFVKKGASVRVVMSESAKKFITPLSFEAITQNQVLDEKTQSWSSDNNHIGLATWADVFIVAPITANSINKLACGVADNLLLESILAFNKTVILAPAANTNMINNQITVENINKLKNRGFVFLDTQTDLLACMAFGDGKMAEPFDIFCKTLRILFSHNYYKNKKVVITGGGTIERIDDVRFLSNFSSGKMAHSLAFVSYIFGAEVVLISSKNPYELPKEILFLNYESTQDLKKLLDEVLLKNDKKTYLLQASAISDFIPKTRVVGKIKKESLTDNFSQEFKKNIDLLQLLDKKDLFVVGFKAEFDEVNAYKNAKNMLIKKDLKAVCLNVLGNEINFGSDNSKFTLISNNRQKSIELKNKIEVGFEMLEFFEEMEF